jgi:hypothetical protein
VTDDFERASLGSEYVGNTQDASIVTSPALEGSRSLKLAPNEDSAYVGTFDRDTPQLGDVFTYSIYLTDDADALRVGILTDQVGGANLFLLGATGVRIQIAASNDQLEVEPFVDGSKVAEYAANGDFSTLTNEWLTVRVELGVDREITTTVTSQSGTEIASLSPTVDDRIPQAGGLNLGVLNNSVNPSINYDDIRVARRLGEETRDRQRGSTETSKLQTRGGVGAGPPTATPNQRRRTVHRHPVTTDATAGQRYVDAQMVGGSPAAYLEGEFDGEGGSYKDRLNAALGRFATVNARLGFEAPTFADIDYETGGSAGFTVDLTSDRPRELSVSHDGSADTQDGAKAQTLTSFESLGGFSVTFHDVTFTRNSTDQEVSLGVTDVSITNRASQNGNGIVLVDDSSGNVLLRTISGGTVQNGDPLSSPFGSPFDLTFEYDGSEVRVFFDGNFKETLSYSTNADFTPYLQSVDFGKKSTSETVQTSQITVSPLTEVLR